WMCHARSAATGSIPPPQHSFCRGHSTESEVCVEDDIRLTSSPPVSYLLTLPERADREDQRGINETGTRYHRRDRGSLNPKHVAIEFKRKIMNDATEEQQSKVDVVVGQKIPAPEYRHRQPPKYQDVAHGLILRRCQRLDGTRSAANAAPRKGETSCDHFEL